jgi:Zn finger protein HypA/HybF involved in hydrogenase expression
MSQGTGSRSEDGGTWAAWVAPQGFVRLESQLDGIEVWGPAPDDVEGTVAAPAAVRCPQCGASARFDVAKGRVGCPFCGWAAESASEVVGRGAAAGEFTPEVLARGAEGFGIDRRELGCGSCGAVIAVDVGALAATCPFCASNQVAIREHATVSGLRPTAILPFAVQSEACRKTAAEWLGQGLFHPDDLGRLARVDGFVGVYVPYWTFSADTSSDWKAEVGTERTHTSTNTKGEQETKTIVEWRWKSGQVALSQKDLLVPGTTRLSARLLSRIEAAFRLDGLARYQPELLAGFQAQTYDVPLPDAWETGRHRMREKAREACHSATGSSHVRSFTMTADLQDESWRHVLLPIWVSAYRYAGRTYVVLIDGSSGQVAGQKPVAWWKVWTAIAVLLSPAACCFLVGIPLLLLGVGLFFVIAGVIAALVGTVLAALVYSHATESEAL